LLISSAAVNIVPGNLGWGVTRTRDIQLNFKTARNEPTCLGHYSYVCAVTGKGKGNAKALVDSAKIIYTKELKAYNTPRSPTDEYVLAFEMGIYWKHV
jgi:hypothetical protein